jgi:large subunit ribosomal protein L29
MKAKDMREKSAEDLRELEKSLVADAFQSRLKNFTNRLDDTSLIRKTKKDLARVITLLRERSAAAPPAAPAKAAVAASAAEAKPAPAAPAAPKKKTAAKKSEAKES